MYEDYQNGDLIRESHEIQQADVSTKNWLLEQLGN